MPIPFGQLLAICARTIGGKPSVFLSPEIPAKKLQGARHVHGPELAPDDQVAVLYDDTVFGGAEDGFLVTPWGLHWKNIAEGARALGWEKIDAGSVSTDGTNVIVAGGTIQTTGTDEFASTVAKLLKELVTVAMGSSVAAGAPYRIVSPRDPRSLTHDEVVQVAHDLFAGVEKFHLAPDIPEGKLRRARRVHALHLPPDQPVAVLFDDTIFGDAEEGFLATWERICWKNSLEDPQCLLLASIPIDTIGVDGYSLRLAGGAIVLSTAPNSVEKAASFLRTLLQLRQQGAVGSCVRGCEGV